MYFYVMEGVMKLFKPLVVIIFILLSACSGNDEISVKGDMEFLNDSKALDKKYGIVAASSCSFDADDYLRKIALHDFAWDKDTENLFAIKFDKYLVEISTPGVITMITDKAKLQNVFGSFTHIHLYCNYDTQKKSIGLLYIG